MYSFQSPEDYKAFTQKMGRGTFVSQLHTRIHDRVFRFVNNNDIVPHPFSIWNSTQIHGHMDMAKYFRADGKIMANYQLMSRLIDSTWGLVQGISGSGFDMIADRNYGVLHQPLGQGTKGRGRK